MKTNRVYRLAAVLLLLLLVAGCDTVDSSTPLQPPPQPFRIDCFVPEGATAMVFEATGAIEDKGSIEGYPVHVNWRQAATVSLILHRNLKGEKGFLALQVEASSSGYGSVLAEGTFMILAGDGVYAHLQGQGTFVVSLNNRGEEVEIFEGLLN